MITNSIKLSQSNNMLNVKALLTTDPTFCNNHWDVGRSHGYIAGQMTWQTEEFSMRQRDPTITLKTLLPLK